MPSLLQRSVSIQNYLYHDSSGYPPTAVNPNNQLTFISVIILSQSSTQSQSKQCIEAFETAMKSLKHRRCDLCLSVSLTLTVVKMRGTGLNRCKRCIAKKRTTSPEWLPVWFNHDGVPQHHVPTELSNLTEGEKLLIQQISPYIPMQHLHKGAYGSKGHVCSFPQAVEEICTILPRLPENVNAISVVKHFKSKDDSPGSLVFRIRKDNVLKALRWLKRHNKVYKDIEIQESNLGWMGDKEEMDLDVAVSVSLEEDPKSTDISDYDLNGGSKESDNCDRTFGILPTGRNRPGKVDQPITDGITESIKDCSSQTGTTRIDFPYISEEPVDEYDESERIFCKAFPWLFPGGVGDINSIHMEPIELDQWIRHLLLYEDGRFARDKMWCFFTLNYSQRKNVMNQGSYFVNSFYKDGPSSLGDLQEAIRSGQTGWIDRITYFGFRVSGSAAYWRQKRQEVYSWINHHAHLGHGAPSLFITLSCAEYYWPDIKRLIEERYKLANLPAPVLTKPGTSRYINEFTLVIQEYFQIRVKQWLTTIGKTIFKIKHHWLRFEFAPGRGQIHAHMLAIVDNKGVMRYAYDLHSNGHTQLHAELLGRWAQDTFSMTCDASTDGELDQQTCTNQDHPASHYFHECINKCIEDNEDADRLLFTCQFHRCSNYCLRKRKHM